MRFPIDVAFVDKNGRIIKIAEGLKPFRAAVGKGSRWVIENAVRGGGACRPCSKRPAGPDRSELAGRFVRGFRAWLASYGRFEPAEQNALHVLSAARNILLWFLLASLGCRSNAGLLARSV